MEEQQVTAEPAAAKTAPPMSFTEKLVNVFAAPGELFEDVRLTPPMKANWMIPMIIFLVVALATGQLIVHNPSLSDQMGSMIKAGMQKSVDEGKMTQERLDETYEQFAKPGSTMFTISQIAGTIIMTPIALFLVALVYWVMGKTAMKSTSPYMKVVEVVGLTMLIGALESIVTTLLMFAMDSIHATPSLAIFLSEYNIHNKLHIVLSKINLFTIWSLGVVSIGLSKIFQRDFPKVLVLVVVLWILWIVIAVFMGIGAGV